MSINESYYSIKEDDGIVHLAVRLSKPLSRDVTIQVQDNNGTAVGKSTSTMNALYLMMQ